MMQKIYGAPFEQNGLQKVGRNKYDIFYGFGKDSESDDTGYNYRQRFDHVPTLDECRKAIYDVIDSEVQQNILHGMSFNGSLVWLSAENQRNYAATALQVQTDSKNALPVTVKLGTDDSPEYVTFNTSDEYIAFANAVTAYIRKALDEGWQEKKAIDWSVYQLSEENT